MSYRFGNFLKECRLNRGFTLREFSRKAGVDPGNYSKMERGLLPPPKGRGKLLEYAGYLGIEEGTDQWLTFFDLAAAEAGTIPEDIANDAELLEQLPLLFRTARGQKLEDEDLLKLVDYLKGNQKGKG